MLKELEGVAPSKEDYSQLCLLLTLNKLSEHPEYRSWNPVKARWVGMLPIQLQIQTQIPGAIASSRYSLSSESFLPENVARPLLDRGSLPPTTACCS